MIGLVLLLIGGAALAAGSGSSTPSSTGSSTPGSTPSSTPGSTPSSAPDPEAAIVWHDGRGSKLNNAQRRDNYAAAYLMAKSLEDAGIFGAGFAEWVRVVAYTEARGNPAAGSDAFSNAARGLLGLRPTTAWNESACIGGTGADCIGGIKRQWSDYDPELAWRSGVVSSGEVAALKDMPWTIALAAHNVSRLRKYTQGGPLTLLGARRGWAFPSLVADHDNSERPELLTRPGGWNQALAYFGLPESFADRTMVIHPSRANFPSVEELHAIILAAIASGGEATGEEAQFVEGTREEGLTAGAAGHTYAWALSQRPSLEWAWGVDRYAPDATGESEPIATADGDTTTRNQSAAELSAAVHAWEANV